MTPRPPRGQRAPAQCGGASFPTEPSASAMNPNSKHLAALCVALSLSFAAPSLGAADAEGFFMVKGAGVTTCKTFSQAVQRRGPELYSYAGWIEGYLSAMNRYEQGVYDLVAWHSTDLLMAALARACTEHPEAGFHPTVNQLALTLRPSAIESKAGLVPIEGGAVAMVLYDETLRRMQAALKARGFDAVEVNGRFDAPTRAALGQFQKDKGLDETGLPDQPTLASLLP